MLEMFQMDASMFVTRINRFKYVSGNDVHVPDSFFSLPYTCQTRQPINTMNLTQLRKLVNNCGIMTNKQKKSFYVTFDAL